MSFLASLGPFIVVLGIIIFVHEFGHFITAKAFGMRVFIFSFGFGKRLLGFKRGDTDYRVSLIPLGGYVKLEGEPEDHLSEDTSTLGDGKDFTSRPRWQKFLVYLAGPFMNAVLTIGVLTALYASGLAEVDGTFASPSLVGQIDAGSPAAAAGLRVGDQVLAVDGERVATWEDLFPAVALRPDTNISLTVRRDGVEQTVPVKSASTGKERIGYIGLLPPLLVKPVAPDSPSAQAGIQPGDALLSIEGKPVEKYDDLLNAVHGSNGRTLRFGLGREGRTVELDVTPRKMPEGFRIGLARHTIRKKFGPRDAFTEALRFTWDQTLLTFRVVKGLLTAQLSPKMMMGPLGIATASGEAAKSGPVDFLMLVAMISLQVGILNLFPLAPLDGGHLAIIGLEGLIRRDLSLDVKAWIMNAGALVLLGLIVVVLYSDLSKTSVLSKYLP